MYTKHMNSDWGALLIYFLLYTSYYRNDALRQELAEKEEKIIQYTQRWGNQENCKFVRDWRPKFHMVYVCDVIAFDQQTNMAEGKGKREILQSGSKISGVS